MQKIKSLALSSNELDRGANLPPPPPKIGSTNTPPKIGLKKKRVFFQKNMASKKKNVFFLQAGIRIVLCYFLASDSNPISNGSYVFEI